MGKEISGYDGQKEEIDMKKKMLSVVMACAMVIAGFSGADMASAKSKIMLSKKKMTIRAGQKKTLKVKGTKKKVKWSSENKKIATVSQKGVVKGIKAGRTKIKAKVLKKTYTCTVTVKEKASVPAGTSEPSASPAGTPEPSPSPAVQESSANPSTEPSGTLEPVKVLFSKESGVYDNAFTLTLRSDVTGIIYYTTDGSDPVTSSTKKTYSGGISVKSREKDHQQAFCAEGQ
ncbi:MAG: Ig-like domain-containing protein [Lachnospiraceae bacterium]|nr:Ig-like domain-containing protein [Lachnospiraceae bacterium]